jgi:hypothetical protein
MRSAMPEAPALGGDLEEILVAERFAAGQRQVEHAEIGDLAQRVEDLRRRHLATDRRASCSRTCRDGCSGRSARTAP